MKAGNGGEKKMVQVCVMSVSVCCGVVLGVRKVICSPCPDGVTKDTPVDLFESVFNQLSTRPTTA